ncbi:hypothetical protein JCM3770_004185 [Rhodotorula araucariae]
MASLEDFDRQVKALTTKGKLSSSLLDQVVAAAMHNAGSGSHLVSTLYRYHKKAPAANKLTSLYILDGIAREARSRQKKLDRDAKGKGREGTTSAPSPATPAIGSTTPTGSPPPVHSPAAAAATGGTYSSFLRTLEGMLPKFVLDNWENGLPAHKDKVRKVLDIWTKASTFSSSALARISQKLLATSTSSATTRSASPVRPSLSPAPISPPRDATPSAPGSSTPSTIPANVLALLQASSQAPPSQAAIEQKRQEELQSEVERVLREAQMGAAGASYSAAPPPAPPAPSYSVPPPTQQPSYSALPPSSSYPYAAPPPAAAAGGLALDPSQLAALQKIAGGLTPGQGTPTPRTQGHAPLQQQQPQHSNSWRREEDRASGPLAGAGANNGGIGAQPGAQQHQQQQQQEAGYDGPRGQTRSYDEAHRPTEGGFAPERRDEPPAKRPFQPAPLQQPQQQQQQQHTVQAPPPPPPVAPTPAAAPAPAPAPLDATAFDATSPASWASFVGVLQGAHPYFAALGRPPSMQEVLSLCAPSALMAFGAGGAGAGAAAAMMGMGVGMGGAQGQGLGQGQGQGAGAFEGGVEGGFGANGGY